MLEGRGRDLPKSRNSKEFPYLFHAPKLLPSSRGQAQKEAASEETIFRG
jgi:hypothetical protein